MSYRLGDYKINKDLVINEGMNVKKMIVKECDRGIYTNEDAAFALATVYPQRLVNSAYNKAKMDQKKEDAAKRLRAKLEAKKAGKKC